MIQSMLKIILLLLAGYLLIVMIAAIFQRNLIYQPDTASEAELLRMAESEGLLPWKNADGSIIGWKTPDQPSTEETTAVIVYHGNAGFALNRTYVVNGLMHQEEHGPWQIFIVEYPGYGSRQGSPSDKVIKKAAKKAFNRVATQSYKQILVFGESLGTGVASYIASEYQDEIQGVMLVSPFTNLSDIASTHYFFLPAKMLLTEKFDNVEALGNFNQPVVFVYGEDDLIVPSSFTKALYESYDGPKLIFSQPDRRHNTINYHPEAEWWKKALNFLLKN